MKELEIEELNPEGEPVSLFVESEFDIDNDLMISIYGEEGYINISLTIDQVKELRDYLTKLISA